MSHTKGPWKFAGTGIITTPSGEEIVLGNLFDCADARLIEAAPTMLYVLMAMDEYTHRGTLPGDYKTCGEKGSDRLEREEI